MFSAERGHLGRSRLLCPGSQGRLPSALKNRSRCGLEGRAPLNTAKRDACAARIAGVCAKDMSRLNCGFSTESVQTFPNFLNRLRQEESLFNGLILQPRGGSVDRFNRTGISRLRPFDVTLALV